MPLDSHRTSVRDPGSAPVLTAPIHDDDFPDIPGYEVQREIARGAMGRVLPARDLNLDCEVAIKVILADHFASDARLRFVRESKITARSTTSAHFPGRVGFPCSAGSGTTLRDSPATLTRSAIIFDPPVNKKSSWEGFHGMWPASIVQQLRNRLLPGYVAEPRVHLGTAMDIDIGALERTTRHHSGQRVLWATAVRQPHSRGAVGGLEHVCP